METADPAVERANRSIWIDAVLVLFLAASLALNVVLGWEVQALRAQLPRSEARTGMKVLDLHVRTTTGETDTLSLRNTHGTVLYIFRPGCKWCEANLPNIQSLGKLEGRQQTFLGISTTDVGLVDYLQRSALPFPVYVIDSRVELSKLGLLGTPQTIYIAPNGEVVHNWIGAYNGAVANSIEKTFGVRLPDIVGEAQ